MMCVCYAERCFLARLETLAKHMIFLRIRWTHSRIASPLCGCLSYRSLGSGPSNTAATYSPVSPPSNRQTLRTGFVALVLNQQGHQVAVVMGSGGRPESRVPSVLCLKLRD
ncbi:unnamed protein product [Vitrella brassicaformis CCMP3155]|uniref:Uncharacterized protein n=2 Tax=Vitrella brassicaformis TaxID=1169539 RepID=A0A0G4FRW1_VITBC|nr:unnamed protein product [Vitrella brassicaformis CCMP3155]|eukprot:CEM16840.1 unnamed protein product [Vitrella brassicaformis CCMP3155]